MTHQDPAPRYLLITGKLSFLAERERAKRVKAGEGDLAVLVELLLREGKGVLG